MFENRKNEYNNCFDTAEEVNQQFSSDKFTD